MIKSNKAYVYDPVTREFVGVARLDRDPLGGGFLLPANATYARPELVDCKAAIYDSKLDIWTQVTDLRGVEVYTVEGGYPHIVEQLGDLPDTATTTKPEPPAGKLIDRFKVDSGEWLYRDDYTGVVVYNTSNGGAVTLTATDKVISEGYTTKQRPSDAYNWDAKKQDWVLDKTKQAELDAQAAKQAATAALTNIKQSLQAHIDSVAQSLGFSNGNSVILYAGFDNPFKTLATQFGAWEAGIWAAANKYMAQVKAGEAPMLTPEQAVERVPTFEFTGA